MRHLPTRTTRHRVIGAFAATTPLFTADFTAPALAAPPEAPPTPPTRTDGLALTPPTGFDNWNSTHCRAEFDEAMVKGIADILVAKGGLKDVDYEYVNLDDCWALPEPDADADADADGKLVPDPVRFPNGIKAVADYVHPKGLKLGVYTSAGTKTCDDAGFPGALGHEYSDDDEGAHGAVAFEIWAHGTKVASTGVLTNAMPAEHLSADVTGARTVRQVVTDEDEGDEGDDGIDSDHADWADATVSC